MNHERSNVVKTFMEIVQIDSPTGREEEMARDAARRLSDFGLEPHIDKEGNVVAHLDGDRTRETYFLNAHLDTVQADTHIEAKIDDQGWILPRGKTILGADNKTAVAAIIETVGQLVSEKSNSHHPLDIVFTVSEESNNHGAIGMDYSKIRAKKGFSFDGGSKKQGDIVISAPFYERFDFYLEGKSGHAGHPEQAINILPATAKALLEVPYGQITDRTVANIAYVSLGENKPGSLPIVNTVPGKVLISGEARSLDEDALVDTRNAILSIFGKNAKLYGLKMEPVDTKRGFFIRENPGFEFSPTDEHVVHTAKILKQLGFDTELVRSMGCYDANLFFQNGLRVLNISDGSQNGHSVGNESIKVSDLQKLQDIIYKLVTQ